MWSSHDSHATPINEHAYRRPNPTTIRRNRHLEQGISPSHFLFTCLRKNDDKLYSKFIFKISFVTTQSLSKSFTCDNLTMLFSNSQNIFSWMLVTNTVKWYQSVGSRYALHIHSQPLRHIWNRRCSEIISIGQLLRLSRVNPYAEPADHTKTGPTC